MKMIARYRFRKPERSFWETGFYGILGLGTHWRYTGKYGLVRQERSINAKIQPYGCEIPRPYGDGYDSENPVARVFMMPGYLIGQIIVSFRSFIQNFGKLYTKDRRIKKDALGLLDALMDFLPALLPFFGPLIALGASVVGLVNIFCLLRDTPNAGDWMGAILISLFFSPLIMGVGAIWGALTGGLMLLKAVLETAYAVVTLLSLPVKALITWIARKADLFKSPEKVVEEILAKEITSKVSEKLTTLSLDISLCEKLHTRYVENIPADKRDDREKIAYEGGEVAYANFWQEAQNSAVDRVIALSPAQVKSGR